MEELELEGESVVGEWVGGVGGWDGRYMRSVEGSGMWVVPGGWEERRVFAGGGVCRWRGLWRLRWMGVMWLER
ncbi:hypothetical protein, partial [Kocuria rhizophila]|uniref:hypothetical protein n=1 Tax=Kocuria rhizophila TaxID=72000 RepID=UPI001C9302A2